MKKFLLPALLALTAVLSGADELAPYRARAKKIGGTPIFQPMMNDER